MGNVICVGLGGMVGSVCRYLLGLLPLQTGTGFPVKTWLINLLGAFVIGMLSALATREPGLSPGWTLFWKTGVCGGFTAFSTFALETADLLQQGQGGMAALYALSSMVLGVGAVLAGQWLLRG